MAKKDLFLDVLMNPAMNLADFTSAGHSAETSALLPSDVYKSNIKIRELFKDETGNFNEDKFNETYVRASSYLKLLQDSSYNISLVDYTAFDIENIWAPIERRTLDTKPYLVNPKTTPELKYVLQNPNRIARNYTKIGRESEPKWSIDELAQTQKVLLNPTDVAKGAAPKWGDAPAILFGSGTWVKDFFKTRVLAQYENNIDDEGNIYEDENDPRVTHRKGEYKLNDNGTYYYENLDGRSVYGKQVLNKLNTITKEGTRINLFDFFDSDDLKQKGFVPTILKNLALVGSMWIPYVGWGVAAASITTQVLGLSATLGKMAAGNEVDWLNDLEGWSKTVNRSHARTLYSTEHPWCMESLLNMVGDIAGLLKEQRLIFQYVPAIFKGKWGTDQTATGQELLLNIERKKAADAIAKNMDYSALAGKPELIARFSETSLLAPDVAAQAAVAKYLKEYNELGEVIARAYMTAITVGDTYGEAKMAGATDFEATLLTLGHAIGENRLLKSDIGRWIMPELKADKFRNQAIAARWTKETIENFKKIGENTSTKSALIKEAVEESTERVGKKQLKHMSLKEKENFVKRWLDKGKKVFDGTYFTENAGKMSIKSAVAAGIAEGTEEVSEELLMDFSRACFNLSLALTGDETRMENLFGDLLRGENLKNDFSRYMLNFIGGVGGGAVNGLKFNIDNFRSIATMKSEQATKEIIHMVQNGTINELLETLDKVEIGNKKLGTNLILDAEGNWAFEAGTAENNQDKFAKDLIRSYVGIIKNVLQEEGALMDDEAVLDKVITAAGIEKLDIINSIRANAFANTSTASRYLNDWNKLSAEIVKAHAAITDHMQTVRDGEQSKNLEFQTKLLSLNQRLTELQNKKNAYLNGENSLEFVQDAVFETNFPISSTFLPVNEIQFAEALAKRPYELIPEKQRQELQERYINWAQSGDKAAKVHEASRVYWYMLEKISPYIQQKFDEWNDYAHSESNALALELAHILDRYRSFVELTSGEPIIYKDGVSYDVLSELTKDLRLYNEGNFTTNGEQSTLRLDTHQQALLGEEIADQLDEKFKEIDAQGLHSQIAFGKKKLLVTDLMLLKLQQVAQPLITAGFAHPEVKQNLLRALNNLNNNFVAEYTSDPDEALPEKIKPLYDEGNRLFDEIIQLKTDLTNLNESPIIDSLQSFVVSIGNGRKNVKDIITLASNKQKDNYRDLTNLMLSGTELSDLDDAIKIVEALRSIVVGMRSDDQDIENLSGNTTLINNASKKILGQQAIQLGVLDKTSQEMAVAELNIIADKLKYIKNIYTLNQGNKLLQQFKVGNNKSYLFYNKLRNLVKRFETEDLPDWQGIEEFKAAIATMDKHKEGSAYEGSITDRKIDLTPDERLALEDEFVQMNVAIYNFFLKNQDKVKDPKKLAQLFKLGTVFNFYGPTPGMLKENTENIDDAAFVTMVGAAASLNYETFLAEYKKALDANPNYAPISTQEMVLFVSLASVVNSNSFSHFGAAIKESVLEHWKALSYENRVKLNETYKLKLSLKEDFAGDPMDMHKDTSIMVSDFLPVFYNIYFGEGCAGAGKTTIMLLLANMLPPTFLVKGIMVGHTDDANAENLLKSLHLSEESNKNSTFAGHQKMMNELICSERHLCLDDNGVSHYIWGLDVIQGENGILISTNTIRKLSEAEKPILLIVDECSKLTQIDMSDINRWSELNGVPVIFLGDLSQNTAKAKFYSSQQEYSTKKTPYSLDPSRNNLMRTFKMGVNMRSGNGLQNEGLANLLAWEENPISNTVSLPYVLTESGIYGNKVYKINDDITTDTMNKIKEDIRFMISHRTNNPITGEKEKIGYIYKDKDSYLYQAIMSGEFGNVSDIFEIHSEESALGNEAQYYIVDVGNRVSDGMKFYHSIYTGVTRAKQGTIVLAPANRVQGLFTVMSPQTSEKKLIADTFTEQGIKNNKDYKEKAIVAILSDKTPAPLTIVNKESGIITIASGNTLSELIDSNSFGQSSATEKLKEARQLLEENSPEPEQPKVEEPEPIAEGLETEPKSPIEEPAKIDSKYPVGTILFDKVTGELIIIEGIDNQGNYVLDTSAVYNEVTLETKYTIQKITPHKYNEDGSFIQTKEGKIYRIEGASMTAKNTWALTLVNIDDKNDILTIGDVELAEKLNGVDYRQAMLGITPQGGIITEERDEMEDEKPVEILTKLEEQAELGESKARETIVYMTPEGPLFRMNGFTFNTFYTGNIFSDSNPDAIDPQKVMGCNRIDNGFGLYKTDNSLNTRNAIISAMGRIHSAARYQSNEKIVKVLKKEIPKLANLPIHVEWAFMSKSKKVNYTPLRPASKDRFLFDTLEELLYMGENVEKEKLLPKTKCISLLVFDETNKVTLEIPIMSFLNVTVAYYELGQLDPTDPVYQVYEKTRNDIKRRLKDAKAAGKYNSSMAEGLLMELINTVNNYIYKNYSTVRGYQQLADMGKLFLFTNNACKIIPDWNLSENADNLGALYVKERTTEMTRLTEEDHPLNYEAYFESMEDYKSRTDIVFSPIMIHRGNGIANIKPGMKKYVVPTNHPFVLFSYDTQTFLNGSADAMWEQFLKQEADPNEPKLVGIDLLTEPEISLSRYVQAVQEWKANEYKGAMSVGHSFTPFRLMEAIWCNGLTDKIGLSSNDASILRDIIDKFYAINGDTSTPQNTHKLATERRAFLTSSNWKATPNAKESKPIGWLLKKVAALDLNKITDATTGETVRDLINSLSTKKYISNGEEKVLTGVVERCLFDYSKAMVGNFMYYVKGYDGIDSKFKSISGLYYRRCGKIDPPRYALSEKFWDVLHDMMEASHMGFTAPDGTRYDNIWLMEGDNSDIYRGIPLTGINTTSTIVEESEPGIDTKPKEPKVPTPPSAVPPRTVRTNKQSFLDGNEKLLAKYNINILVFQDVSDNASNEELWNKVIQVYNNTPGNFGFMRNGTFVGYSINETTTAQSELTEPRRKVASESRCINVTSVLNNSNTYIVTFLDKAGNNFEGTLIFENGTVRIEFPEIKALTKVVPNTNMIDKNALIEALNADIEAINPDDYLSEEFKVTGLQFKKLKELLQIALNLTNNPTITPNDILLNLKNIITNTLEEYSELGNDVTEVLGWATKLEKLYDSISLENTLELEEEACDIVTFTFKQK